eukprot:Skav224460  [mRNA]  locus=scaffold1302:106386:115989:+ [translate_table: standard]
MIVEVSGKHGSLKRDFKHLPIELFLADGGKKVVARMYFAKSKQCSMLNTDSQRHLDSFAQNWVCSHISNLFEGVTSKFEYKMRLVYAHFPINVNIINGGKATGTCGPQSCLCKKKDIRKFLDGIYVSSHGVKEDWSPAVP